MTCNKKRPKEKRKKKCKSEAYIQMKSLIAILLNHFFLQYCCYYLSNSNLYFLYHHITFKPSQGIWLKRIMNNLNDWTQRIKKMQWKLKITTHLQVLILLISLTSYNVKNIYNTWTRYNYMISFQGKKPRKQLCMLFDLFAFLLFSIEMQYLDKKAGLLDFFIFCQIKYWLGGHPIC